MIKKQSSRRNPAPPRSAIDNRNKTNRARRERNKKRFLETLSKAPLHVGQAADSAGVGRSTAYLWRREDEKFKAVWEEIQEGALDQIEHSLYLAATVPDQHGRRDTRAAQLLLAAYRRE